MLADPETGALLTFGGKATAPGGVPADHRVQHSSAPGDERMADSTPDLITLQVFTLLWTILKVILPLCFLFVIVQQFFLNERLSSPYWGHIHAAHHCTSYGVRQYSAVLLNVVYPFSRQGQRACQDTELSIPGRNVVLRADQCQLLPGGIIIGQFTVADISCKPFWGDFLNKGCVAKGSRLRRIESQILHMRQGDDWMAMCSTMPAVIYDIHYATPTHCLDKAAIWEINDAEC